MNAIILDPLKMARYFRHETTLAARSRQSFQGPVSFASRCWR